MSVEHRGKDCNRSHQCGVGGCQLNHHRLLHDEKPDSPREGADGLTNLTMTSCESKVNPETFSLRTVPVWVKGNGKKLKVNAILDDASNESFMNEEVAGLLGLKATWQTVQVRVLNDSVETFKSMPLQIEIESVDRQFTKTIDVQTCPKAVTGSYRVVDWNSYQKNWPHPSQCNFPIPSEDGFADLLIGVDNLDMHVSIVDFQGPPGGPVARLGPLGWTCIGPPDKNTEYRPRSFLSRSLFTRTGNVENGLSDCCSIDRSIRNFWEVENIGTDKACTRVLTEEDKLVLQKVESVPWKSERPQLPNNRQMAVSRLTSTEKNLKKNPEVAAEYQKTIDAYVSKGYLRKVNLESKDAPAAWYLPHFPIVRMDKPSTKVRIVFDCSAKCDGVSLNDVIHSGPKLQNDLFNVLIRFRRNPIVLVCDIWEMYLQIKINEKDRPTSVCCGEILMLKVNRRSTNLIV